MICSLTNLPMALSCFRSRTHWALQGEDVRVEEWEPLLGSEVKGAVESKQVFHSEVCLCHMLTSRSMSVHQEQPDFSSSHFALCQGDITAGTAGALCWCTF